MLIRTGIALSVSVAFLAAGCGGPGADPEQALRALCNDDASVTETDSDAADSAALDPLVDDGWDAE